MIIGNGLLANEFLNGIQNFKDCIVLCAGVSNSAECNPLAYQREKNLIDSFRNTNKRFVYFSTVSVFDNKKATTAYVEYKKKIEKYIVKHFKKYAILRLPIVVSQQNNDRQLMGYIKSKVLKKEELILYTEAKRYLFNVKDIPLATRKIVDNYSLRSISDIINVGFQQSVSMVTIGQFVRKYFPDMEVQFINSGGAYYVDFEDFEQIAQEERDLYYSNDVLQVLETYFNEIKEHYHCPQDLKER